VNEIYTTAPPETSTGVDPEFVDLRGFEARFGVGRSTCYNLIADGLIRSVVLRRRGQIKGRRLIDVSSVRKWLASLSDAVDPVMSENARKASRASTEAKKKKREARKSPNE
jgi:hypothetical protein